MNYRELIKYMKVKYLVYLYNDYDVLDKFSILVEHPFSLGDILIYLHFILIQGIHIVKNHYHFFHATILYRTEWVFQVMANVD